jgi:hypothetical protein
MTAGYNILLFFVVLGAASGFFSQIGLFGIANHSGNSMAVTNTIINSTQAGASSTQLNIFASFSVLVTFMGVIAGSILACIVSIPLMLYMLGLPVNPVVAAFLQLIQTPAQYVMFMWLFELWNHSSVGD